MTNSNPQPQPNTTPKKQLTGLGKEETKLQDTTTLDTINVMYATTGT